MNSVQYNLKIISANYLPGAFFSPLCDAFVINSANFLVFSFERKQFLYSRVHFLLYMKLKLQNEAYSKQFNVLIHGIPEDPKNRWESRDSTVKLFHKFLIDGLKSEDFDELPLVKIHRLPQRPIDSDKGRVNRPIIIKLYNSEDAVSTGYLAVSNS